MSDAIIEPNRTYPAVDITQYHSLENKGSEGISHQNIGKMVSGIGRKLGVHLLFKYKDMYL